MDFQSKIVELLVKETKLETEELANLLTVPPDPKLGDYAFPCFKLGKNPQEAAQKLKEKIQLPEYISKIEVAGAYLNFFLKNHSLAEQTLTAIYQQAKNYGKKSCKSQRIVIEYCGPNTNKPLHLGHLRNMALGNSVCRILSFQGNEVFPVNIVNDRGIHICQSMLAYLKWGNNKSPDKKGDHFVGDYYVLFSKKAQEDENLKQEAQELLLKWEQGDKEIKTVWKKMNSWVLDGFAETYHRFGIKFVKEYFESQYYQHGKSLVQEGLKKKIFEIDPAGNIIAPLEKYKFTNKVLLRKDETSVYITQDMYLANLRYQDFKFDKMIYVVASEQRLHFQQLFKILELLEKKYAKNMYHLSYGLVHLPSGRMKSREGTVIDADDIMDEVSALAEKEVLLRHKDISSQEAKERAESISLAAIKFFMLQTDAVKDLIFNPEKSLSFEGETGPYLQYTHARACSILEKANDLTFTDSLAFTNNLAITKHINFGAFNLPEEIAVVRHLYKFPEVVEKAAQTQKPHLIAQYLIALAQSFNEFYHQCPVISEQKNLMKSRLLLVDCVRQVLDNGLNLLGITALKKM